MKKYIVTFKNKSDESLIESVGGRVVYSYKNLPRLLAIEINKIDSLANHPTVECIEEDQEDDMDEGGQRESYAIEGMGGHKFWGHGYTGAGVKVAVMDGGCQEHEDLNVSGGYNAYDPTQPYMRDYRDHGTHVAGIIGMVDNDKGYVGLAHGCDLYIVKLDNNEGGGLTRTAQIEGINWCIENDIDIVNCSFSSMTDDSARREAFRVAAEDHGIIIVCSAGNRQEGLDPSINTIGFPSSYDFVVTVANLDENKKRFHQSSCGQELDFSAYGTNIMSTVVDTDNEISTNYGYKTGTSMAAPYISSMFALYKEMYPDLNREELIKKMVDNTEPLGSHQEYGYGLAQFPDVNNLTVGMKHLMGDEMFNILPISLAENIFDDKGNSIQNLLNTTLGVDVGVTDTGNYLRFANGLQICWGTPFEQSVTEPIGNMYRSSDSESWVFPKPFYDENSFFATGNVPSSERWAQRTGMGEGDSISVRQFSPVESSSMRPTFMFAIGFWKQVSNQM